MKLVSVDIAKKELLKKIKPINKTEQILLSDGLGRYIAENYKSNINLPAQDNSAVDGYGFNFNFLKNNPESSFKIAGTAKAGHPLNKNIHKNESVRIFTGAIVPKGINIIIMQENCISSNDHVKIKKEIKKNININLNIRPCGENIKIGENLLRKGIKIGPQEIGQLAAAGFNKIKVKQKIKVGILSTGDELEREKRKIKTGKIFDSNTPMLKALCKNDGFDVCDFGIVKDNASDLSLMFSKALKKTDLIISSGGASEGIEDHAQTALKTIGAKPLLWKLAMKPGRPMAISILGNKPIFCMPGNPVAVFVCYKLIVSSLIEKYIGVNPKEIFKIKLPSGFEHSKKSNRTEFLRAKLSTNINSGKQTILLHGRKGAGVISSLISADGLVEIPLEVNKVKRGMFLNFIPFGELGL